MRITPTSHATSSPRRRSAGGIPRPPALVFGSGLTVLGVIRALGRQGIDVYCAQKQALPVSRSRWCQYLPGRLEPTPNRLEAYLDQVPLPTAVAIPCSDHWVRAVSTLPEKLKRRFPSSLPPIPAVDVFTDKGRFAEMLQELRIPHPVTLPLHDETDWLRIEDSRIAGGFLKPCDSQEFGRRFRVKAWRVSSREDGTEKYRTARNAGLELLFQEYIPGPASNHYFVDGFVDRSGSIMALFARRRWRMYPPDFGNSCYLRSVPLTEVAGAVRSLNRLLPAINYRGIFSAEFKRDPRDDTFRIIEVNARPWWFIGFAADCGIDVAGMAYLDALKRPVQNRMVYPADTGFVLPMYDRHVSRQMIADGELTRLQWLRQWLTARQAVWAIDDPWPSVGHFVDRTLAKLHKILGKSPGE